ncbi:MAG TPA: bifunctional nuclease domain-containing protein, partial [Actinomycetota bacterium]|nr:bifunctional nuclease domain-containing protein [Actinomycetota bacterium]
MIEMSLAGVRIELPTNQPIVLLREAEGERFLPIWIGQAEAAAIALALQGVVTPRPMTHDLLKNILEEIAVQV